MKKITRLFAILFAVCSITTVANAAENYTLDEGHTFVQWHIKHFGFSNQTGKFYANGSLTLDDKKPANSKVNVTIQINDMVTGIPKMDEHLKGAQFFNVAEYPTATFVSDKVTMTGKDTAKVTGNLTLHGVTKPVVLNVKLNKMGMNPITEKDTAGFSATTKIKRSDFGMKTMIPNIGDDVTLTIEAEASKS